MNIYYDLDSQVVRRTRPGGDFLLQCFNGDGDISAMKNKTWRWSFITIFAMVMVMTTTTTMMPVFNHNHDDQDDLLKRCHLYITHCVPKCDQLLTTTSRPNIRIYHHFHHYHIHKGLNPYEGQFDCYVCTMYTQT